MPTEVRLTRSCYVGVADPAEAMLEPASGPSPGPAAGSSPPWSSRNGGYLSVINAKYPTTR